MIDVKKLGQEVRRLRKLRQLSQRDLADRASVASASLQDIEIGKGNPTIKTLNALEEALGTSLVSLASRIAPEVSRSIKEKLKEAIVELDRLEGE